MRLRSTSTNSIKAMIELVSANPTGVVSMTTELSPKLAGQVIKTELWPEAVPASMIVRDEPMKKIRANAIVTSFIKEPIKGKKVLDLGCGDGHCVTEIARVGGVALGYDPVAVPDNPLVTTDLDKVNAEGPYDVIMLYDVLDHVVDDAERAKLLALARQHLKPGGKIYVRCHPYTSRHGLHNYYKFNKAYAQLFLTPEELAPHEPIPTVRTLTPLLTYKKWFAETGLVIGKEELKRHNLDDFFSTLTEPLMKLMAANAFVRDYDTLNAVLSVQFADFVLQPS